MLTRACVLPTSDRDKEVYAVLQDLFGLDIADFIESFRIVAEQSLDIQYTHDTHQSAKVSRAKYKHQHCALSLELIFTNAHCRDFSFTTPCIRDSCYVRIIRFELAWSENMRKMMVEFHFYPEHLVNIKILYDDTVLALYDSLSCVHLKMNIGSWFHLSINASGQLKIVLGEKHIFWRSTIGAFVKGILRTPDFVTKTTTSGSNLWHDPSMSLQLEEHLKKTEEGTKKRTESDIAEKKNEQVALQGGTLLPL
jgi:hypothetical protein